MSGSAALPVLSLHNLSHRFGQTQALDQVDFELFPGEIHALLGENGAGKSTLMNTVGGLLQPESGTISLNGNPVLFAKPLDSRKAGIGMVHQHFLLVPNFTVAENLALFDFDQKHFLNLKSIVERAKQLAEQLGWNIPWNQVVTDLPVGTQQRVEILKALLGNAKILLFDEPTAVLTPNEVLELFTVLRALRSNGHSIVFVSHKLSEVIALCDRVTVLRQGRVTGRKNISETNEAELARLMVGIAEADLVEEQTIRKNNRSENVAANESPIVALSGISTQNDHVSVALRNVTFSAYPGEIVGIAGVDGNGQTELADLLTGQRPWTAGSLSFQGQVLQKFSIHNLRAMEIAWIPPDRRHQGLALSLSTAENLQLETISLKPFRKARLLNKKALAQFSRTVAAEFDIRVSDLNLPVSSLSGGNQQKVVVARALWRNPKLLIAVSPTRGLDIAAAAYVHRRLRELQTRGAAVILISTDLDEILALSSRVLVIYEGRIVGQVTPDTPREAIGLLMGGRDA